MRRRLSVLFLMLALVAAPSLLLARGGSGGGGGSVTRSRVTGYLTLIDYANRRVQVGQSYYGSALLTVAADAKIQVNNESVSIDDLVVGDWAEVNYDALTRVTDKIAVTR